MSLFSDWDIAYGVTYEALNRKLNRIFYKQRQQKHLVKHLVARVLDPDRKGLTGDFSVHVVKPGKYDLSAPPIVEVSYFNEQLQREQRPTEAAAAADLALETLTHAQAVKIDPTDSTLITLAYTTAVATEAAAQTAAVAAPNPAAAAAAKTLATATVVAATAVRTAAMSGMGQEAAALTLEASAAAAATALAEAAAQATPYEPILAADGTLTGLRPKKVGGLLVAPATTTLICPPGIEIRRHSADTYTDEAVVLTGLRVGNSAIASTQLLRETLADWLTRPTGILNLLHRHLAGSKTNLADELLAQSRKYILGLATTTPLATACGELLQWLMTNVWLDSPFWMSAYLRTLLPYKTADLATLQALYAYALKLTDNTDKDKNALLTSTDDKRLRKEIGKVFNGYFASETAAIGAEATFRAKEALLKSDFNFGTNTLKETTLSASVTGAASQPIMQALLEVFACLEPTLMPDLAFGITGLTTAQTTVFGLRLGAWQIALDDALGSSEFKFEVPIVGGYAYDSANASERWQIINDRNRLLMGLKYTTTFLKKTHKNSTFRVQPSDPDGAAYIDLIKVENNNNTLSVTNFKARDFSNLVQSDEVKAFFKNLPRPTTYDPTRYAYEFSYTYTPLFSTLNILSDLPRPKSDKAVGMSWARVTEYRFVFLKLYNDSAEQQGQLYVLGSINSRGSTTTAPDLRGGDLNQLVAGSDSFLYISRVLLTENVLLLNVPPMFLVATTGDADTNNLYRAATVEDFMIVGGEIRNRVDIAIAYKKLRSLLKSHEQELVEKGLEIPETAVFSIPELGFRLGARDNRLFVSIDSVSYGNVFTISGLAIDFDYLFKKQNGIQRYTLDARYKAPTVQFILPTWEATVLKWGAFYYTGLLFVAGVFYTWYQRKQIGDLAELVPIGARMDEVPDQERAGLLAALDEVQRAAREPARVVAAPDVVIFDDIQPFEHDESHQFLVERQNVNIRRTSMQAQHAQIQPFGGSLKIKKYSPLIGNLISKGGLAKHPIYFYQSQLLQLKYDSETEIEPNYRYYSLSLDDIKWFEHSGTHIVHLKLMVTTEPNEQQPSREQYVLLNYEYGAEDITTIKFKNISFVQSRERLIEEDQQLVNELRGLPPVPLTQAEQELEKQALEVLTAEQNAALTAEERADRQRIIVKPRRRALFAAHMEELFKGQFREQVQRVLLETAQLRHKHDHRTSTAWKSFGEKLLSVSVLPGLYVLQNLVEGWKAGKEAPVQDLLSNRFINLLLRTQLDTMKFPFEEHFDVNGLTIDQDGLKVTMGALHETTLTFQQEQDLSQAVSTYVNVRDVRSIRLSLDGLREFNNLSGYATDHQRATVDFTIGFGVERWVADEAGNETTRYFTVGNAIPFQLVVTFDQNPTPSASLSTGQLELAQFQPIGAANILVVTRVTPSFRDNETNSIRIIVD